MERVFVTILILIGLGASARADVVLSSPDKYNPWEEQYPESRFGTPPAQVDLRASLPDEGGTYAGGVYGRSLASVTTQNPQGATHTFGKSSQPVQDSSDLIPDRQKGVQEVSVIASDLGFFPRTIFVTRNIPVRIFVTGASAKNSLCVMMDEFNVRKHVKSNEVEEINFTPSAPGQYRFYCPVNNMQGTMVVRELASKAEESGAQ